MQHRAKAVSLCLNIYIYIVVTKKLSLLYWAVGWNPSEKRQIFHENAKVQNEQKAIDQVTNDDFCLNFQFCARKLTFIKEFSICPLMDLLDMLLPYITVVLWDFSLPLLTWLEPEKITIAGWISVENYCFLVIRQICYLIFEFRISQQNGPF